jgi:hypothetical protein
MPAGTVIAGVMDVMLTGVVEPCNAGAEEQPVEVAKKMRIRRRKTGENRQCIKNVCVLSPI